MEAQREAYVWPPAEQDFAGASFLARDAARPADLAALQEANTDPLRGADAASRLRHRRSESGLLKTGFEPQWHTVVVAGLLVHVFGYDR